MIRVLESLHNHDGPSTSRSGSVVSHFDIIADHYVKLGEQTFSGTLFDTPICLRMLPHGITHSVRRHSFIMVHESRLNNSWQAVEGHMHNWTALRHPNIIEAMGVCRLGDTWALIFGRQGYTRPPRQWSRYVEADRVKLVQPSAPTASIR
jgi:hypothetical protein